MAVMVHLFLPDDSDLLWSFASYGGAAGKRLRSAKPTQ
jgi:hypothetical protein